MYISELYDDNAAVEGLRRVDYANNARLTITRECTVKPDRCFDVNSKSEHFWLYPFSIELQCFIDTTHIWGRACCN